MICIELDYTGGQLELEGFLYSGGHFLYNFQQGDTILLARHHIIDYLGEFYLAPFYWVNLVGGWGSFFFCVQNYAGLWLVIYFMVYAHFTGLYYSKYSW